LQVKRQGILPKTGEVREEVVAGGTSLAPERADARRLRALVRPVPARSVRSRVSSAADTKRWLLRRSKLTRPSRSHRRSVSTLTPMTSAAAPIRMS